MHAHEHLQICFSVDFPGRYTYRGRRHDVPVGAVSVLDAWEPHAASDPCDRDRLSHYIVIYMRAAEFRAVVDMPATATIGTPVHVRPTVGRRFRRWYRALSVASTLEQDVRLREFASAVLTGEVSPSVDAASSSLIRARDYIAAHAHERVGLSEIAAVADLTPWHFARAFRRRFGIPPHRFQLSLRIDRARHLLAAGLGGSDVAQRAGFADQSHLIRSFKRITGQTPTQYQGSAARRGDHGARLVHVGERAG
jgi:AraC-like DNA-binding protein